MIGIEYLYRNKLTRKLVFYAKEEKEHIFGDIVQAVSPSKTELKEYAGF